MEMFPITGSSHIAAYGYEPNSNCGKIGVLAIKFHNGKTNWYREVPLRVFEDFLIADSRGRFFTHAIAPYFDFMEAPQDS